MLTRILLIYKQHRFETIAISVLCLGLAAAGLIEAFRLFALNTPVACLGNGYGYGGYVGPMMTGIGTQPTGIDPCQAALNVRYGLTSSIDFTLVMALFVFAPFIAGLTFGAPLVARELEQGTAPLSWSLAGSRRRWLLFRMLAMGGLLVVLLGAVAISSDVYQGTMSPTVDVHASFATYTYRGAIDIFWGLAAFLGTVALGTIFGRTLPAVFIAVVICFFARGGWEPVMNRTILPPLAVMQSQDIQNNQSGWSPNDLYVYYRTYLDGKPWDGDLNAWWNAHQPAMIADPSGGIQPDPNAPAFDPAQEPQQIPFLISGSQYWPVVALESGILLLGSLICGAVALIWVDRRRPY
jgi:hypothetical protein